MHIVFGGAFNGKRQYVKDQLKDRLADWHEGRLPEVSAAQAVTVIAGLEQWVKKAT